jgi:hypothetical protein
MSFTCSAHTPYRAQRSRGDTYAGIEPLTEGARDDAQEKSEPYTSSTRLPVHLSSPVMAATLSDRERMLIELLVSTTVSCREISVGLDMPIGSIGPPAPEYWPGSGRFRRPRACTISR